MMKKLGLAALFLLPLAAGCYAETYPAGYYGPRHGYYHHGRYGRERAVYVAPAPRVYVAPPPPARYYY
jgi:hypothetical protein